MTHPGTPRDTNLAEWLHSVAHHPPANDLTVLAHETVRRLISEIGTTLWQILPPGREKSLVFSGLDHARWAANQAIAVHGGPREHVTSEDLQRVLAHTARVESPDGVEITITPHATHAAQAATLAYSGVPAPGQRPPLTPDRPFTRSRYTQGEEPGPIRALTVEFQEHWADPAVTVELEHRDEGENIRESVAMDITDPEVLREHASVLLSAANRLEQAQTEARLAANPELAGKIDTALSDPDSRVRRERPTRHDG